jgi:ketosteroid isomerase-like protein
MPATEDHVRRYYELVDAEDYEALFDLFSDDIVYHRPGQPPIEGAADFRDFYYEGRPLEDGSHEVLRVVVDGDTAVVQGRFTGRQGDDRVDFGFVDIHEFEDSGTIARRWTYTDRDEV